MMLIGLMEERRVYGYNGLTLKI